MIYIVSGWMRSGTSMMMKALMNGGLTGYYDESRNKMNDNYGDEHYKPNEGGFFEPKKDDFADWDFPKMHDGKVIKVLHSGIPKLPPFQYNMVIMRRDVEEMRQSYEGFFNNKPPKVLDRYEKLMTLLVDHADNRRDMKWTMLNYRDVVENPRAAFSSLLKNGFPIDVEKASQTVDPALYRYRKERLEVGI